MCTESLYGLRQAPRQWYFKLTSALLQYGFQQSPLNHSLFIYHQNGIFLALLIDVNDMMLVQNSSKRRHQFMSY